MCMSQDQDTCYIINGATCRLGAKLYILFRSGQNCRKISYRCANRNEKPPYSTSKKISAYFDEFQSFRPISASMSSSSSSFSAQLSLFATSCSSYFCLLLNAWMLTTLFPFWFYVPINPSYCVSDIKSLKF